GGPEGSEPRGPDDGGHGERTGAADAAVPRHHHIARRTWREEQPQVRLVLRDATKGNLDVTRRDVLAAGLATTIALLAVSTSAQSPSNPRYGRWKLKSDAPAPTSNIMTYEPYKGKGMTITIDAVSKDG